jgi:hypothetical protein
LANLRVIDNSEEYTVEVRPGTDPEITNNGSWEASLIRGTKDNIETTKGVNMTFGNPSSIGSVTSETVKQEQEQHA